MEQEAAVEPPILQRSERVSHPLDRYVPSLNYVMLTDCGEPSCYKESLHMAYSNNWMLAMQSEM